MPVDPAAPAVSVDSVAPAAPAARASTAMSAKNQIKRDFKDYWDAADKSRLEAPDDQRALFVSAHRYAACLTQLSRAAAATMEEHQRIFLQEISSDAIHIVHVLIGGDARGARFYLRSILENFWRHHYFRDHPVEYRWLHSRSKYYLELKTLRDHCAWLECFHGKVKPLTSDLNRLYGDLSSSVHSTSSKTLVLRAALADIRLSAEQAATVTKDLHDVLKACLGLMFVSEHELFSGLHVNTQDLLLSVLSVKQRRWVEADHANGRGP
jgi:hypothetical protein